MTQIPSDKALVPFVSVENMMRLVQSTGLDFILTEIAAAIEEDFLRWDAFDKTPRIASHSDVGVIELMPTSDGEMYGFKYVNGHPKNTAEGLQTVTAFGLLADVDTGYPVFSEFQCHAFKAICGIDTVRLFDIDPAATAKCAVNLKRSGLSVRCCTSTQEAVESADIITTCTADKQYATILTDNMVGSGVHINAIGGDCPGKTELHQDILLRSDIFVEYPPQTRVEGEIQALDHDHPVTELHDVFAGRVAGRTSDKQITLFDSVGFAIEDFSALRTIKRMIDGTSYFQPLDMLADPDDPRDLFGMLQRSA